MTFHQGEHLELFQRGLIETEKMRNFSKFLLVILWLGTQLLVSVMPANAHMHAHSTVNSANAYNMQSASVIDKEHLHQKQKHVEDRKDKKTTSVDQCCELVCQAVSILTQPASDEHQATPAIYEITSNNHVSWRLESLTPPPNSAS